MCDSYTPNANMADHSIVARDEQHESEVSQSLMFCFDNASQRSRASSSICSVLFRCAYELLCFWMRRERIEIFHRSPLRENSGSMQFVETKKRSSRSQRELKFVRYFQDRRSQKKSFKWRAYVVVGGVPIRLSWPAASPSQRKALLERCPLPQSKELFAFASRTRTESNETNTTVQ